MATNAIDITFDVLKRRQKKAVIAYLAAGYPKFNRQERIISGLEKAGVDIIELGIPFSDPIADGPTIQFASQEALKNGTTLKKILRWAKKLTKKVKTPVVLMGYLNSLETYGLKKFAKEARLSGISGVIVPDMIPEESAALRSVLKKENIHLIFLVAPTTPRHRQMAIAKMSSGFLYAVSVTGVTGARRKFSPTTKTWLKRLQALTQRPVCVGFGISGVEQVRALKPHVDGFIVGSALIDTIRKNRNPQRFMHALAKESFYGRRK